MADPQGLATFPGVEQILSAEMTLSAGITPSVCQLSMTPQRNFAAEGGTLTFTYGGSPVVTLRDCKVDSHSFRRDAGGETWSLAILDRRWKWAWGSISGSYNERDAAGELISDRKKSPRELAQLCLDAMGEQGADTSDLPEGANPQVDWDHDNPAQALADLCDQFACRVVLRLNDRVKICKVGQGADLPDDQTVMDDSLSIDPPEKPKKLLFVGGKTRYQCDFKLRAVGEDTDGAIKPIDDLSYKPAAGWTDANPPEFDALEDEGQLVMELAKATVFRWYRLHYTRGSEEGTLDIPGYGPVDRGDRLLPIESTQVQTCDDELFALANDATVGAVLPAKITGIYYDGSLAYANTENGDAYRGSFSIDGERGIVQFSDYVYKMALDDAGDETGDIEPAELYLRTSFSVKDATTGAVDRYEKERTIGTAETPPRVVKHEDVVKTVYATYVEDTPFDRLAGIVDKIIDNVADIEPEADHYLDAVAAEYQTPKPAEKTYGLLRPIDLDGAIQQVTWSVGPGGATTRASRNDEFSLYVPSYKERRKAERLRAGALAEMQAHFAARRRRPINPNNPFSP